MKIKDLGTFKRFIIEVPKSKRDIFAMDLYDQFGWDVVVTRHVNRMVVTVQDDGEDHAVIIQELYNELHGWT